MKGKYLSVALFCFAPLLGQSPSQKSRIMHLQLVYIESEEHYFIYQTETSEFTYVRSDGSAERRDFRVDSVWEAAFENGKVTPSKLYWWIKLPAKDLLRLNSGRPMVHFFSPSPSRPLGSRHLWVVQVNFGRPAGGRLALFKIPLNEEPPPLPRHLVQDESGDWSPSVNDYVEKTMNSYHSIPSELYWEGFCFPNSLGAERDDDRIVVLVGCDTGTVRVFTLDLRSEEWARATLQSVKQEQEK